MTTSTARGVDLRAVAFDTLDQVGAKGVQVHDVVEERPGEWWALIVQGETAATVVLCGPTPREWQIAAWYSGWPVRD